MMRTIDANTQERQASEFARYGARYYPVDPSYDKRVYENSVGNWFKIIGCLFAFWICNGLHWWGVLSLGIVDTNALSWYSIGCFFFTVFFLGGLLCSGRGANKLKRHHEYYIEKLSEIRSATQERETKLEQERIHAEKLKIHQAKLAEIAAQEAAKAGNQPAPTTYNPSINSQPPAMDQRLIRPDGRH